MASLIGSLHELTESSCKKDVAAKICSEILLRFKEVVKKYLWEGEDVFMFHVAPMYPILSRELLRWDTIIKRRMKAITSLVRSWKIVFTRKIAQEVFDLLKLTIVKGNYGKVVRSTRCVDNLEVIPAIDWMSHVIQKTNSTVQAEDILYKRMKDGSFCKGIILPSRPLLFTYSKSQEQIKVTMCYGFWNASGVPQHNL